MSPSKTKIYSQNLKRCFLISLFSLPQALALDSIESILKGANPNDFKKTLSQLDQHDRKLLRGKLVRILREHTLSEKERYVALSSLCRQGTKAALRGIEIGLGDPSWMVRHLALRLAAEHYTKKMAHRLYPFLSSPALTIRHRALQTLLELKPEGLRSALIATLTDKRNYRHGKPVWIPRKSLQALKLLSKQRKIPSFQVKTLEEEMKFFEPKFQKEVSLFLKQYTQKAVDRL